MIFYNKNYKIIKIYLKNNIKKNQKKLKLIKMHFL